MAASVACVFFFDAEPVGQPGVHALDACALCTKPLARDSDIFMYRGDTPFCSDECQHEQMQLDAACARQAARTAARRQKQFSSATGSGRARRESWEVSFTSY
nr:FCS-Like Zinc finger 2-like [Aegilops tauschii subsp. strangulata]